MNIDVKSKTEFVSLVENYFHDSFGIDSSNVFETFLLENPLRLRYTIKKFFIGRKRRVFIDGKYFFINGYLPYNKVVDTLIDICFFSFTEFTSKYEAYSDDLGEMLFDFKLHFQEQLYG